MAHQPTRDEVLAAVQSASVLQTLASRPGEGPRFTPATKADVAERIAFDHGATRADFGRMYESRASAIRKYVSLSGVAKHLDALVADGTITAVGGDHWSVAGKSGVNKKSTFYLSDEAKALATAEKNAKAESKRQTTAHDAAVIVILNKYADELAAAKERILEANPATDYATKWGAETPLADLL